jgi:phage terminase large subunit-like protein
VQHKTDGVEDGISTFHFKSFEQGRAKFQGDEIHFGWADEEPPFPNQQEAVELYSEFLTRLTGNGLMFMTYTPYLGQTMLTDRMLKPSQDKTVIQMTLDEAEHYSEEDKRKKREGYAAWERDAREKGIPRLGQGRVYPYDPEAIMEEPLTYIPPHWVKIGAVDFGIGHDFAFVLLLWDRDNDVVHVHHTIKMPDALPINHAASIKTQAAAVPIAWPQDGYAREKGSGEPLASLYKAQGLQMLPNHATFIDGSNSVESGVMMICDRITNGKLKVARHLSEWFTEFNMYHREDGKIVKSKDDLMDATRYGIMMLRFARAVPLGNKPVDKSGLVGLAKGTTDWEHGEDV